MKEAEEEERKGNVSSCCREQYLFNVFEVIVSTLESKLQRIENLDKAVEHLMRRVEALDSRVNDNIDKTDAVITKLRTLDLKLFNAYPIMSSDAVHAARVTENGSGSNADDGEYAMPDAPSHLVADRIHFLSFSRAMNGRGDASSSDLNRFRACKTFSVRSVKMRGSKFRVRISSKITRSL